MSLLPVTDNASQSTSAQSITRPPLKRYSPRSTCTVITNISGFRPRQYGEGQATHVPLMAPEYTNPLKAQVSLTHMHRPLPALGRSGLGDQPCPGAPAALPPHPTSSRWFPGQRGKGEAPPPLRALSRVPVPAPSLRQFTFPRSSRPPLSPQTVMAAGHAPESRRSPPGPAGLALLTGRHEHSHGLRISLGVWGGFFNLFCI